MSKRESKVEQEGTEYAERQYGWKSIKLNGYGNNGKPDKLYFRGPPPEIIFIEYKRDESYSKLQALQKLWRRWIKEAGFRHYSVRTYEEAKKVFDEIEKEKSKRPKRLSVK